MAHMSHQIPAYVNVDQIKAEYAPYNTMDAFEYGYNDATLGRQMQTLKGVDAQAYDRGYEAGSKVIKMVQWIEANVGSD